MPRPISRRHVLAAGAAGLLLLRAGPAPAFERSLLTIRTADGARHRFEIELALTTPEHAQGLMFRESLAEDAGMLFVYEAERPVAMWMKNTIVSLDMLFLARDGTVVSLVENTTPQSLDIIPSGAPVKAVLELLAGTCARLGIRPGDQVLHPLLVP